MDGGHHHQLPVSWRRKRPTRNIEADKKRFLTALGETAIASVACRLTGIPRSSIYAWRSSDRVFRAKFKEASEIATERLEAEAVRRGMGWDEPVFFNGRPVMMGLDKKGEYCTLTHPDMVEQVPLLVRKYSDRLLMFVLRARNPKFRNNYVGRRSGARKDEPVSILVELVD